MDWITAQISRLRQQQQPQQLPGNFPTPASQGPPWYNLMADGVNYFIILPLTLLVRALLSVLSLAFKTIYQLERPRESIIAGSDTRPSSAIMNDTIRRAEHFVLELEELLPPTQQYQRNHSSFGYENLPPFFQGSYSQALYMASSRAKFLFVYLTNPITEGSRSLFEKVIINKKFVDLFKGGEKTLIWGGNVAHAEAYQLATNLNITKFPMLGLLCLTGATIMTPEGPRKETARISLILKIQGGIRDSVDVEALIHKKFVNKMRRYEPEMSLIRAELRERMQAEDLLRTQQANYQKSLEQDRLKKQRKQDEELLVKYLKWRQRDIVRIVSQEAPGITLRIAFKFENGDRTIVNFPQDSTIEDIFTYVELYSRDMLQMRYEVVLSDEQARNIFKRPRVYNHRLTSSVPPISVLNNLPLKTPVKDVDYITPSGLLMVERTDDT